jgi:hypothetical protein
MRRLSMTGVAVALTIASSFAPVQAGGRARVVVSGAPKHVIAGQSFDLGIQVIPQSWSQRRDVQPLVVASCGDRKVTTSAVALAKTNAYRAKLALPSIGAWTIRVDSRYCETVMRPLEIDAVTTMARR